jgi:hypothetical protein
MSENEIINVFRNGFKKEIQENNSEVQCFECLEKAYVKRVQSGFFNTKLKVTCKNGHQFELIDFCVMYSEMVSGLNEQFFLNQCANSINNNS